MNQPPEKPKWRPPSASSREKPASWRKAGNSRAVGGEQHWRSTGRTISPVAVKRVKLLVYSVTLLALLVVFVAWVLFRPRPVPMVALTVVDYAVPLDPNSWAWEDLQRFERVFQQYRNIHFTHRLEGRDGHWKTLLDEQLEKVRSGGPGNGRLFPDNDVLLLFISAHGAVDRQGRPALLMSSSDSRDDTTWVPVLDVIAHINRHEHVRQCRKVLMLDAGRIRENWPAGILHNGFAELLQQTLVESRTEGLYVINATRGSQLALSAPELGGSVFAYYVAAALRGAADTNEDGQIRLHELADYLRDHVCSWANGYRAVPQQPLLIPADAEDFGLAYATRYEQPEAARAEWDRAEWEAIDQLWERYVRLENAGLHQRAPLECAALQTGLGRLETLFLAGQGYREQLRTTWTAVERALADAEVDPLQGDLRVAGASLEWARWTGALKPEDTEAAAETYAQWLASRADAAGGASTQLPPVAYESAAAAVWQSLRNARQVERNQIAEGLAFLQTTTQQPTLPAKEVALLGLIHDDLDWDVASAGVPSALAAYEVAEQTAVPLDVRAQYWVRPLAEQLEQRVRLTRDELFVGSDAALAKAETSLSAMLEQDDEGAYPQVQRTAAVVCDAYQTRDRACAMAPFLAQWLLRDSDVPDRLELVSGLLQMIQQNRELSAALDWQTRGDITESRVEAVGSQAATVARRLESLLGRYQQVSGELAVAKAGTVGTTITRILRTLQVPLATQQRASLRRKLLASFPLRTNVDPREAVSPGEITTEEGTYLTWLTNLPVHPALALLEPVESDEDVPAGPVSSLNGNRPNETSPDHQRRAQLRRLAEIGGTIRDRLRGIEATQRKLAASTEQYLSRGEQTQAQVVRQGFSKADHVVRSAAGLLGQRPWLFAADDPSVKLRRLDLHYLLLWQGQRVLGDFWGPLESDGTGFFADAARQYLVAAASVCRDARADREQFGQQIARYEAAAANWSPVAANDLDVVEGQRLISHQVTWLPGEGLPPGEAALFVRWADGGLVSWADAETQQPLRRREAAVDDSVTATTLRYLMRQDGAEDLSGLMEAVAYYRGHERSAAFFVGQGSPGATVAFQRPRLGAPRIRVKGDSTQKTQIVFVLDCSSSMKEAMAVENQQQQTRLQIARSRLSEVVESLEEDFYHVGLILYGHRAGWKTVGPGRYEVEWRSEADRQRKLHPSQDVELVVPVRAMKFTDLDGEVRDVRQVIASRLSELRPYGETPLYFAIIEALRSFDKDLPGPRHVVVITDGVNEQTGDGAPAGVIKLRDDVQQALQAPQTRAQIDIIGFGLKSSFSNQAEEQKWRQGQADLKAIARDPLSGGDFHEAQDPSSLLQRLRDSLRLVKFFVQRVDEAVPDPATFLDLNQTWAVRNLVPGSEYVVRLAGHEAEVQDTVRLEGGESLLLVFNRAANRLEHQRFDEELRAMQPDVRDPLELDRRYFIGAHLPERQAGTEVWFRISVQNANAARFSPRPRQIWCEIRPLPARDRVFYVSDAEFEPDQSVPVLRLRVAPWPLEAQHAEIQFWFRMNDAQSGSGFDMDLSAPGAIDVPQAQLQLESQPGEEGTPYRIVVIEQHLEGSTVYPLRVMLRPPADHITHSYFAEMAKVRHVFAYEDRAFWRQEEPHLFVTPIRQAGALDDWVSSGPLEIDLTRR